MELSLSSKKIHPKKFALYVAFLSIIMMFTGFTSAYIVRKSQGRWLDFDFPTNFFWSTIAIVASSIILHIAYKAFLNNKSSVYRYSLVISFLLGLVFIYFQIMGWKELEGQNVFLQTNPSGSFLYVISGMHLVHVLGGVIAMILALIHAFYLPFKVTKTRILRFELTVWYWHFVDILWIYLLIFFLTQQ